MKQILIFILFAFINCAILPAQNFYAGVVGNAGVSRIVNDRKSENYFQKPVFSGNTGFVFNWKIGDKSAIGCEAVIVFMNGKHVNNWKIFDFFIGTLTLGEPVPPPVLRELGEATREFRAIYIGLPVYFKYTVFNKLDIMAGIQFLGFNQGAYSFKSIITTKEEEFIRAVNYTTDLDFDKFDYGPKFGLKYPLTSVLYIRADYYHGLSKVLETDYYFYKNRQATIGLEYSLTKTN